MMEQRTCHMFEATVMLAEIHIRVMEHARIAPRWIGIIRLEFE